MNATRPSVPRRPPPIDAQRLRQRPAQFSPLNRRLVYDGHVTRLSHPQLALYLFLECVSDPHGLSYYSDPRLCHDLHLTQQELQQARAALVTGRYLLFQPPLYQLLDLPPPPSLPPDPLQTRQRPRSPASSTPTERNSPNVHA
jgi:hypothetical protein